MKTLRVKAELLVDFADGQGMGIRTVLSELEDKMEEISFEWDNCDVPEGVEMPWGEGHVKRVVKIDGYEFTVIHDESPFCEHCGENYASFGTSISDDGTHWCIDCHEDLTDEEKEDLRKEERKAEKKYLKKRLKELEKEES